jgi:hypothetical protein
VVGRAEISEGKRQKAKGKSGRDGGKFASGKFAEPFGEIEIPY